MFRILSTIMSSPLRVRVLTFFFRRVDAEATISEVASTLGSPRSSVSREISALVRLGMLSTRVVQRVGHYRANKAVFFIDELTNFLSVTTPEPREITAIFRSLRSVSKLVISGLLTNEEKSSLDILVIGKNIKNSQLEKTVKKVEALTALPLRYALFTPEDFKERNDAHDRLLRDVFEYKHEILIDRESR